MKIISIDPSINNVGVAYCDYDLPTRTERAWATFLYQTKRTGRELSDLVKVTNSIVKRLKLEFVHGVDVIILEYPQFFSSEKGATAAVQGFTLDLAYICGVIAGAFQSKAEIHLYTPSDWKGQQTKNAIEYKFLRKFKNFKGFGGKSEHEQEAAMMIDNHIKTHYGISAHC